MLSPMGITSPKVLITNQAALPALSKEAHKSPSLPQQTPTWDNVSIETHYFYNDSAQVEWFGQPRSSLYSPYNQLFNWTTSGTIEAGVWSGNPGNATITVVTERDFNETETIGFLNYTMENFVRFVSYPSLSIFNFSEYVNASSWIFTDEIASITELFNDTFYFVHNATRHFIDGFNVTGLVENIENWRILMQWDTLTLDSLYFSYSIRNATINDGEEYIFSLGKVFGRTTPLEFSGSGTLRIHGPYDRMILNATPSSHYNSITFPYFPIGEEVFVFIELTSEEFDLTHEFRKPSSSINISREVSSTQIARGQTITINVTVANTGEVPFSEVTINDQGGILSGAFTLISGTTSTVLQQLDAGTSISMVYTVMPLQSGAIELPSATAITVDLLSNQLSDTTDPITINVGAGMLPSEQIILIIGIAALILVIVILILYRFRRRIF
jgi:uncharacterized repeat protein (TIGR01451 family)